MTDTIKPWQTQIPFGADSFGVESAMQFEIDSLRAQIESSRKQEPVGFVESVVRGAGGFHACFRSGVFAPSGTQLYAAPVVPEDVPTEATEVAQVAIESVLREYNYPANPKNAARAGWRACRLHIAAMKGEAA